MKKWIFYLGFFLLSVGMTAQNVVQISGTVTSGDDGLALPGVNVVVKGTQQGTSTDLNGHYLIKGVPSNAILQFSFVGMKSVEVPVKGRNRLDVVMQPLSTSMDEVVVVGYGVQKKSVVTGSIDKVEDKVIERSQDDRIEQLLQGRTPGVIVTQSSGQPGASSDVIIRGRSSINSGTQPLYVVDGVPVTGGIDYLNPDDIKSMEVLKDAASAAIYGSRAANGVILITTKSGKNKEEGINLSFSSYAGVQNPWKKLDLLNATEYAVLMNEASVNSGMAPLFDDPSSLGVGTDWQEVVFNKNAAIHNTSLSLSGSTKKSRFFTSMGYYSQDGIVAKGNSNYNRLTLRFNSDHKIKPWLRFGNKIGYAHVNSQGVAENTEWGSPLSRALNMDPVTPLIITDPATAAIYAANYPYAVKDGNGNYYGISPYVTSEIVNPEAALSILNNQGYSDKLLGSLYFEVEPIKNLKIRSSFGADLSFWGGDGSTPKFYLNATNYANYNIINRSYFKGRTWNWDNTISYNLKVKKHDITLLAGTTAFQSKGDGMGGSKQGMPYYDTRMNYFDYAIDKESENLYGYGWESTLASIYGRLNYNYGDKYLLTAILRRDGSSRFGANNRYAYFPSVSVGWIASHEDFLKDNASISFLKIRTSWGNNGNQDIGDFAFTSVMNSISRYTFGVNADLTTGYSPANISNPDLKWETVEQFDAGFDLGLFANTLMITVDYYKKTTRNMLVYAPIPLLVGNASPLTNLGDMRNSGLEMALSYHRQWKNVVFNASFNMGTLSNKVIRIGNESGYITGQTWGPEGMQITRISEGEPYGYFFGYKTNGIFQNEDEVKAYVNDQGDLLQPNAQPGDVIFQDINGDGVINELDRTKIGDATPNLTLGFNIDLEYKHFDMTLFLQGVTGNQIYNATHRYDLPYANRTSDIINRWYGEGTSNTLPRITVNDLNRNYRSSDLYVEDGSYLRIKNLQVGYTFQKSTFPKLGIEKLRVYLSASNLLTLTKYSGYDPEIIGGIDRGIYPQPRTLMFGLKLDL